MEAAVRRQRRARVDRRISVPVGEAAAGLLDQELARRQVPRLQIELGVDLGLALGDQAVARVVPEAALTLGGVDQPHELVPAPGLANRPEPGVQEKRVRQAPLPGYANTLAVQEGAGAAAGCVEIARHRIVDDPEDRQSTRLNSR